VTLVHGTFARDAGWVQPDAPLSAHLRKVLGEAGEGAHVVLFNWSGGNSVFARAKAARDLVLHLEALQDHYPEARHYVVAHSHGGNVALYAASLLQKRKLSGIACLATPFLQARPRDITTFAGQSLRDTVGVLFATVAFFVAIALGASWPWVFGLMLVSLLEGAFLALLIGMIVRAFAPMAGPFAATIDARVPDGTDVLIVRATGDEASFVLGAAQLLSWVSSKAFDWMLESSSRVYPPFRFAFPKWRLRGVSMPYALRWLWVVVIVFPLLSPACSVAFGRQPAGADLQIACFGLFIAVFATLGVMTTVLEGPLLGAAFLFFAICVLLNARWLGTVPSPVDLADAVPRRASGAFLALIVEVNAEPAPPGHWKVHQLDYGPLDGRLGSALQHSVYEDPRTLELIAAWLRRGQST
jgi:hypothetical protein